jgi:Tfp pilus assembly protein PilF
MSAARTITETGMRRALAALALVSALAGCGLLQRPAADENRGVATLSAALRQYEEGQYVESARMLQSAIDQGLTDRERISAYKHLAFIHCAEGRERQCREQFRKALAIDPRMELAPTEAGHPVWGPVFRALKAGR